MNSGPACLSYRPIPEKFESNLPLSAVGLADEPGMEKRSCFLALGLCLLLGWPVRADEDDKTPAQASDSERGVHWPAWLQLGASSVAASKTSLLRR